MVGSLLCTEKTASNYKLALQRNNGDIERLELNNFSYENQLSGNGRDSKGYFTVSGDNIGSSLSLTKRYNNGDTSSMFIRGDFGASLTGEYTEGSQSGFIIGQIDENSDDLIMAKLYASQSSEVFYTGGAYGDASNYSCKMYGLKLLPFEAKGQDNYGLWTTSDASEVVDNGNSLDVSYTRNYAGFSVRMTEKSKQFLS